MSTTQPVLLYGAEIWADSLDREYRKNMIGKIQRTAALRISSAYRTVSENAVLVISGTNPIDLLAKERKKMCIMKKKRGRDKLPDHTRINPSTMADTIGTARDLWTLKVILDVIAWTQKNMERQTAT